VEVEPRILGFRELCRGRRFVFGQVEAVIHGRRQVYDTLRHPGAVAVVAVDEAGRVLLERQYRPSVGEWLYEIPAGTLEPGESPEETARRELVEETGYEPGWLRLLARFYTSPGISTEEMYIYAAGDLRKTEARPEEDELIETLWVPMDEALEMIKRGEIRDGKTVAGLLLCKLLMG